MIFPASVPAGRCKQILVRDDPAPESGPTPTDLEVSYETLANSHLSVELDERGIGSISVRGEKLFGAIGLHLRQHTFDFTLCADQNLESGKLNTLARQQAQPPVGEQSATLPVARLRASRGGRRADASY